MADPLLSLSNPSLYQAVQSFEVTSADVDLSFTERLAADNAWPLAYAQGVVEEYRRFLYLLALGEHPVCPSDAVDQAWHLHLLYTRSYWQELCGKVLGKNLYHDPTQGGVMERDKFKQWYTQTLATYQREFGVPAPSLIWPDPEQRFAPEGLHQRLRLHDYKILTLKDYKTYKSIVAVIIALLSWMVTGSVVSSVLGFLFWVFIDSLYAKQCTRCHRNHALKNISVTPLGAGTAPVTLWKCKYCGSSEWHRDNKNLSNDNHATCGAGCGDGGCGGGGCGGGGCGG